MLDVNRLRVFRAVVAGGSVQSAATSLGYTPSAISQQLTALSRETGLTLFEKSGRGIAPTAAARRLAQESDELMGSLARLGGVVEDLRTGRSGNVSIGAFASAAEIWTPHIAKVMREEFPDVLLNVVLNEYGGNYPTLDIDVRTEDPSVPAPHDPGRHPLMLDPYVLLLPPDHPRVDEDAIAISSLAKDLWVDDELSDTTCGKIMRNAWRAAGYSPRFAARTADHHATKAFVAAGLGVAMMPRLALDPLPAEVVVRRISTPEPARGVAAYVREGADVNPAVRRVVQLLEEIASQPAAA